MKDYIIVLCVFILGFGIGLGPSLLETHRISHHKIMTSYQKCISNGGVKELSLDSGDIVVTCRDEAVHKFKNTLKNKVGV